MRRLVAGASIAWLVFTVANLALSGEWALWFLPNMLPPLAFVVVPVVVAAVGLAVRGARWAVAVTAAGALVLGAGQAGLNPAALGDRADAAPPGAIRVVSWNTEAWHLSGDPASFYSYLREQRADVLLLQEYQPADQSMTKPLADIDAESLGRELPGYRAVAVGELLVLSRLPVVASRALPAPPPPGSPWLDAYRSVKSLRVDVSVGAQVVSFYDVHIPVPLDLGQSPLSAGFYRTIQDRWEERRVQWEALAADLAANPHPVVLAGDLNSTPAMGELRHLPAKLRDAAPAMDAVYPVSWSTGLPLWRLDWLFTTADLTLHRYTFTVPPGMSDHRVQTAYVTPRRSHR